MKPSMLMIGRVVHEDDQTMLLEVAKDDSVGFTLDPETPDRFYTVVFMQVENRRCVPWKPWEDEA